MNDDEKAKQIYDLYFDTRTSLLPPNVRTKAEKALSNVQEARELSFWQEIRDIMAQREGAPPTASHAGEEIIKISKRFTILRIVYGAVVAHEFAHVVQLNLEQEESLSPALRFLDALFNPLPRSGRRSARRETGAFAEQWDYEQLFDKPYREQAIQLIEVSDLPRTKKREIIESLRYADLPREEFIRRMKRLNHHTNLEEYMGELIMKAGAYAATIAALFYYF